MNVAAHTADRLPRLIDKPCWAFRHDGSVMDLAAPDQSIVCFHEMAATLSKIPRFNGWNKGMAYSDAQHCVMGAVAVLNEGGSHRDAALFLLHDGHEWVIGDITRPAESLLGGLLASLAVSTAIDFAKSGWDEAIYRAAGLPPPSLWTAREKKLVKSMDDRMCAAESIALFGPQAAKQFPKYDPVRDKPKTQGAIRPWGAGLAEEQFIKCANRLIGEARVVSQAAIAAAARALR